ncbi:4db4c5b7-67cd-487a-9ccd-6415d575e244 [Sclerotinia trifoliorum]|uniref:Vacuolar membrane-associated protein IML1 n=1 Tax=Sclerotinia trifoliorum TaxID=28548 RepID=A0A8H2ZRE6_9HELO|nr:4db4c5b7-67cd-487a-9ccd-6415d575e244 [Sclerotinia trifoliorum]
MSTLFPLIPRRGNQRVSHLRQVSNGSSENGTAFTSRPVTSCSSTGTIQHDSIPIKLPVERRCNLWTHDETFSKDEVILNLDLFPDVKAGELMAIVALKTDSGFRDFQEKSALNKPDIDSATVTGRFGSYISNQASHEHRGKGSKHEAGFGKRYLFLAKDMPKELKLKQPSLEVSLAKPIADLFNLKHRSNVLLCTADSATSSASHVEMSFKDQYLARSDMWRLTVGEMVDKAVYKGQKILFMGTIKAQVTSVYIGGRKVESAFFSATTKPIFRSESARYVLFIQMSREMWDFDSEGSGEIMFNKVVNGFLPALFKKWVQLKVKHLVSIVLFTRVEYDTGLASELARSSHDTAYHTGVQTDGSKKPYKDFYRVVVSEMASGEWTTILYQLKREFKFFRKDISMHRIELVTASGAPFPATNKGTLGTRIEAEPSLAMHGNVLEAIDLASTQFAHDYIDRDLVRTGISIVVVTPCAGLFEVDYETLRKTTESLIGNGIGIDLVCLPKMPLHSVPLFRYRNPRYAPFQEALHFKALRSEDSTPRQTAPIFGSYSSLNESLSPPKVRDRAFQNPSYNNRHDPSEWSYAIPHWIDVSFWTGASQDLLSTHPLADSSFFKKRIAESFSDFAIRCKMYEMEMASVMENAMTEIAVPPLQLDVVFSQMVIQESRESAGLKKHPYAWERVKLQLSLSEFVNGPSKPILDRHATQAEKKFVRALDTYDVNHSEIMESFNGPQQKSSRSPFKPGSEETVRKVLTNDPKLFGTSFTDDSSNPRSMNMLAGEKLDKEKQSLQRNDPVLPRKSSVSNAMPATKAPAVRPTKLNRQISLGKYGFGIAAPKGVAAELHTENASAAKPVSTLSKESDSRKKTTFTMTNHLLNAPVNQDRPPSSNSERSKMRSDSSSIESKRTIELEAEKSPSIRPMTIKSALQSLDSTNQFKSRSVLSSFYEGTRDDEDEDRNLQLQRTNDNQKIWNSKLLARAVPELPSTLSPTTALSPWLSVLNPSNPTDSDAMGRTVYRRWQHVFPKPIRTRTMKWKSLCSPASVPLTTESFPTKFQLETEYQQKPYNISQNFEDELSEDPNNREDFLRELISLRLSQGFQIVIGPAVAEAFGQKSLKIANVFDRDRIAEDGASVFMSMGNIIHQLSCVNGTEVEVNMFVRKPTALTTPSPGTLDPSGYYPAIRTTLSDTYVSRRMTLGQSKDEYNWNYVDSFIAGFEDDMNEHLRFWRARFVLIPVVRPTQSRRDNLRGEDNEEEVRLEGIRKLTQMWQSHRYVPSSERRFQSLASRKIKDSNPLDIVYKTEDPSVVVSAELETLPLVESSENTNRRGQLLETDRFRKSKLDVAALAEAIQAPVEKGGVRMQNRRWHFRLHYNCFIGSDMTTWLLENFEDIEDRDQAVELGNLLMVDETHRLREKDLGKERDRDAGIFVHVEKRHPFRDGQYFYQVTGEFAKQRPDSRSGWFSSRRRENSVPSTPMSDVMPKDSPRPDRARSSSTQDDSSNDSGAQTPTTNGGKKPKVSLSKVMKYDVDHRKRSYRPELINLHYDRLHNPDNCYHIRIDWLNVTAKLIEDAIHTWATTAEQHGLRLVEAPIGEACSISSVHPFRSPYLIELSLQPPDQQPRTYFDVNSFTPQVQTTQSNRHYYQKAIMKKFNFVLDIEAAKNFPSNVDVTYSWGRPDYTYTQYIHRSGVLLAQITDEGNFLLLANRLYNNRTASARESDKYMKVDHTGISRMGPSPIANNAGIAAGISSPFQSPILRAAHAPSPLLRATHPLSPPLRTTADVLGPSLPNSKLATTGSINPDIIKAELEEFCHDSWKLELFYKEVFEKVTPPHATPPTLRSSYPAMYLDSNIPTLGLPPGILARDGRDSSPTPIRLERVPGIGSSLPILGRRPSVQMSMGTNASDTSRQESPRGSIAEG